MILGKVIRLQINYFKEYLKTFSWRRRQTVIKLFLDTEGTIIRSGKVELYYGRKRSRILFLFMIHKSLYCNDDITQRKGEEKREDYK